MFSRKKYHDIRWDDHEDQKALYKITLVVDSVQPFKSSLFGIKNSPAAFDFVPNAVQVLGKVQSTEEVQLKEKDVSFLVPEEILGPLAPGETITLWLSHINKCFKFEK
jgi:hypothetical protein